MEIVQCEAFVPKTPREQGKVQKALQGAGVFDIEIYVLFLAIYMTCGTFLLYYLERDQDAERRASYDKFWKNFTAKYAGVIDDDDMQAITNSSSRLFLSNQIRPKVDLYQMFYLALTTCATVGFGQVVPETPAGRAVIIVYGLFGCSAVILFYNLFLERMITLLALVLRTIHEYKTRRKTPELPSRDQPLARRNSTGSRSSSDSLENWKPSVYWVMVCLFCLVMVISIISSWLFAKMEDWLYFEGLYFSFITYATIGFGDYVSACKDDYGVFDLSYRVLNVVIMIVGISSLYSLFNVVSIIIKHGLNYLIKKMDQHCQCRCRPFAKAAALAANRRNAVIPGWKANASNGRQTVETVDRRYSDEVMDVREFLQATKVSLAVMQKDLFESAQRGRTGFVGSPVPAAVETGILSPREALHLRNIHAHHHTHSKGHHGHDHEKDPDFRPGNIGPMAIVEHTLGEDS